MFAVIAHTEMDMASVGPEQLEHMVSVVRGSRGFVRGYWARDPKDPSTMHAVVVFEVEEDARGFATSVLDNVTGASLRVVEILAEA